MTALDMSQTVKDDEVFQAVRVELHKARSKYGWWPSDMIHAAAIASEESGEVVKAVNNYVWQQGDDTPEDIRKEAVQAIAMWVRFLTETPVYRDRLPERINLAAAVAEDMEYAWINQAGSLT